MAYLIQLITIIPTMIFFLAWIITQDFKYALVNAVVAVINFTVLFLIVGTLIYFGIIE